MISDFLGIRNEHKHQIMVLFLPSWFLVSLQVSAVAVAVAVAEAVLSVLV